jgi:hypothetical protein
MFKKGIFMMKKRVIIASSISAVIYILSVIIYNYNSHKKPELLITNSAPYHINIYTSTPAKKGGFRVIGPYLLGPGDTLRNYWVFDDVKPDIYLFYKSSKQDEELLRWAHNIPFGKSGMQTMSEIGKKTQ